MSEENNKPIPCPFTGTSCDVDECPDHYCDIYKAMTGRF